MKKLICLATAALIFISCKKSDSSKIKSTCEQNMTKVSGKTRLTLKK